MFLRVEARVITSSASSYTQPRVHVHIQSCHPPVNDRGPRAYTLVYCRRSKRLTGTVEVTAPTPPKDERGTGVTVATTVIKRDQNRQAYAHIVIDRPLNHERSSCHSGLKTKE